ncbi:MAG: GtrA family protein [Candidatus Gastranaerophilales bacterium]|nr:GtrA family protein [Candidatus Gastranaerophilales bacterium]
MKNKVSKEFIKYCLVGVVNTLVGTTSAFIALDVFMLNYAISTAISYVLGIITSFLLNKKYTFHNTDKGNMQFVKFFLLMLPSFVFSYWFGFKFAHFLAKYFMSFIDFINSLTNVPNSRIIDNFAILISIATHVIIGFSVNKFYVFKKK